MKVYFLHKIEILQKTCEFSGIYTSLSGISIGFKVSTPIPVISKTSKTKLRPKAMVARNTIHLLILIDFPYKMCPKTSHK